jgi:DNA-directed RNA polymerase specialized sigma24 family protein
LAAIREDPKVKNLARARAGDSELAEDALQETYYAVARLRNPERVLDLRAYYCRVLLRNIHRLRSQLGAILIDDFGIVADTCQRKPGGEPPPPPFDEEVGSQLMIQDLLRHLTLHRAALSCTVPGRSPDLARYREVIVTVAEHALRASVAGGLSDAEQNLAYRTLYPQWFAEAGVAISNIHQRFARARTDVYRLLQQIIKRRELYF